MAEDKVISVALLSASCNIILQVLVRIISSLSNAIIFRFICREALGVINVRLLLLYSTCHCLSREAFRRSCLSTFDKKSLQQKFNLLWLIVPVCFVCSFLLRYIWLYVLEKPDPTLVPDYTSGVNIVILSVLIESLAEPIYVFSQSCHFIKLKVVNEGLMLTIRSFCMVVLLSRWPHSAMYCFCFSQILSSIVYTCSYYGYFTYYLKTNESNHDLLINSIADTFPKLTMTFVHLEDLKLVWSFFKQTLLKQLLTEGERYLMTFFSLLSFAEQGLYDVVNNLGSLAARFIFLPIEDSSYLLFTQLLPRNKSQSQENITLCLTVLGNILKLMALLGLTILVFGISYSQLLLYLYGGTKLSSGIGLTLMRWHCFYVLLLAVNGISEGFKFAVMSHVEIDRYNKNLVLLSISFLLASYGLVTFFGSVGFILANCLNMLFRIVHSFFFIQNYFKISKMWFLMKIMPHTVILLALSVIFCITYFTEAYFCCMTFKRWIWHLLCGGWCFLLLIVIIWNKEKALISFIQEQWRMHNKTDAKLKST
ncbi:man(5)GlcNAc(2)-PP-dolichol translocation protein RFT1 [Parasteatoda tepidariorum]|uniref:Protein RFT1 homolog n=1 Tax=Parasteatoda tepidariorum TaxID=114398 RepID=A0A2L2YGY6_PARTP|nr:protein RFT1 homolog [Parasteatoda tepidariorum]